jgi:hypothetical protein
MEFIHKFRCLGEFNLIDVKEVKIQKKRFGVGISWRSGNESDGFFLECFQAINMGFIG